MTPTKSIRKKCLDCSYDNSKEITNCPDTECALYTLRLGKKQGDFSPIKAIRIKCLWCMDGNAYEVNLCPSDTCSLWPFRSGKNHRHKGNRDNIRAYEIPQKA